MANDTYTADADGRVFAGRFDSTPITDFIASISEGVWTKYSASNINELLPASEPEYPAIAILETDNNRKLTNWANKWGYDRVRRKIVGIGTSEGYLSSANTRGKHVTFDFKSNSFIPRYAPLAAIQQEGHIYDRNSSIPDKLGRFWASAEGSGNVARLWLRDPISELYVFETTIPAYQLGAHIAAVEVFPEWGQDGGVVVFTQKGSLAVYDLNTKLWSLIAQYETDNRHYYGVCIYVNGFVVFGGGEALGAAIRSDQLYRLNPNGTISNYSGITPNKINCKSNYKYIPSPKNSDSSAYYFENDTKRMFKHDLNLDTFTDIGTIPPVPANSLAQTVFISLRGLDVIACLHGRGRTNGLDQSEFWLYKVGA